LGIFLTLVAGYLYWAVASYCHYPVSHDRKNAIIGLRCLSIWQSGNPAIWMNRGSTQKKGWRE